MAKAPTIRTLQDRKFVPRGVRSYPTVKVRNKATGAETLIRVAHFDPDKHEKLNVDTKALQAEAAAQRSAAQKQAERLEKAAEEQRSAISKDEMRLLTEDQIKLLPEWNGIPRKKARAAASKDAMIELIMYYRRNPDQAAGGQDTEE